MLFRNFVYAHLLSAALPIPKLNYSNLTLDNDIRGIQLSWEIDDIMFNDIEYVLLIINSSSFYPETLSTKVTSMNLTIHAGTKYNISVTVQWCGENLTSNTTFLYFEGILL